MLAFIACSLALSMHPGPTLVSEKDHRPTERSAQQDRWEMDMENQIYLSQMAEKARRQMDERLDQLQWEIDKTRQEMETQRTQQMLRSNDR